MLSAFMQSRRGLFIAAALLALILILMPARVDAPEAANESQRIAASPTGVPTGATGGNDASGMPALTAPDAPPSGTLADSASDSSPSGAIAGANNPSPDALLEAADPASPAGADLSERTQAGCMLHRTLYYAPCGHSVQRREPMPSQLVGLSRQALDAEIGDVLPGAMITGFSGSEVDATFNLPIPCPLHWTLDAGEGGSLVVMQNVDGEALSIVRETDVPLDRLTQEFRASLPQLYDDVQALEGVLESLGS